MSYDFKSRISDFLGGDNYISGKYVALPMILDAFVLFIYNVIVPAEYFTKKHIIL